MALEDTLIRIGKMSRAIFDMPKRVGWRRLEVATTDADGRIVWTWPSADSGAKEGAHGLQLSVHSVGASRVLQVEILPAD